MLPYNVLVSDKTDDLYNLLTQHDVLGNIVFITNNSKEDYEIAITQPNKKTNKDYIQIAKKNSKLNLQIKKPFYLREIFDAIKKLINSEDTLPIKNGIFKLFPNKNLLLKDNKKIALSDKETMIIKTLMDNSPNVLSKDKLLKKIWGYNKEIDTHTLETHIYRIRQKTGEENELIKTDSKGYLI